MHKREYRCAAQPLGKKGGVCGAKPSEHNSRQATIVSATGIRFPQHTFVAQEVRGADES